METMWKPQTPAQTRDMNLAEARAAAQRFLSLTETPDWRLNSLNQEMSTSALIDAAHSYSAARKANKQVKP